MQLPGMERHMHMCSCWADLGIPQANLAIQRGSCQQFAIWPPGQRQDVMTVLQDL